jgi:hypothetical protein
VTGDWKGFNFDSIMNRATVLFEEFKLTAVRISASMPQDSFEYWIAVAAWQEAKEKADADGR